MEGDPRLLSPPRDERGEKPMKRNQWPLPAMLVALIAVLSLSGTATASTPGTNSGTGTERSPDPDDSDCDVYLGDIKSPDKIFPEAGATVL